MLSPRPISGAACSETIKQSETSILTVLSGRLVGLRQQLLRSSPPMNIGPNNVAYIDGGLGLNNPINILMDEARQLWPSRDIACIVSIGTGVPILRDVGQAFGPLIKILKRIATDTEETAKDFKRGLPAKHADSYFRFNVQHGLGDVELEEWKRLDKVEVATMAYLEDERERFKCCASKLALSAALSPSDVLGSANGSPDPVALRASILETAKEITHGRYLQASRTVEPTATRSGWFFESPEYIHWSGEQSSQSLVLFGPLGCGKSISSKLEVKRLLEGRAFNEVVTFYFLENDGRIRQSPKHFVFALFTLVAQIVGLTLDTSFLQNLADEELEILNRAMKSADKIQKAIGALSDSTNPSAEMEERLAKNPSYLKDISEDTLWRIFNKFVLTARKMTVYIVLGGIDGTPPGDRARFIRNLRAFLDSTNREGGTVAKALISSRRYPDIEQHLDGWPFVDPEKEQRGQK